MLFFTHPSLPSPQKGLTCVQSINRSGHRPSPPVNPRRYNGTSLFAGQKGWPVRPPFVEDDVHFIDFKKAVYIFKGCSGKGRRWGRVRHGRPVRAVCCASLMLVVYFIRDLSPERNCLLWDSSWECEIPTNKASTVSRFAVRYFKFGFLILFSY